MFQKIHFIKITDFNYRNAGDIFCSPLMWFMDFFNRYSIISHCLSSVKYTEIAQNDVVIIGGGGLLHYNPWFNFNVAINKILDICDNVILWGAGFNCGFENGKQKHIDPPICFSRFKLYGIRDYNCESYAYTPCASSMNPLLKVAYNTEPKVKIGSMGHPLMREMKLPFIKEDFSHFNNINSIMNFIGNHEVIVTNSYHCALWSLLANRKVLSPIGIKSGNKFNFLECQPTFFKDWSDKTQLQALIDSAINYPDFLDNSVNNVIKFFEQVKAVIQEVIPDPCKTYQLFYEQSVLAEYQWKLQKQNSK